jgi:glycine/D-amino acid oxidase-like deaminating enzyme
MNLRSRDYDAIVIGAGFYGASIAVYLSDAGARVALLDRGPDLLTRASYANQARVHNGYHYPRSFLTGLRASVNFPRFVADFQDCIHDSFEQVYAIPHSNTKVSAHQFRSFCRRIGVWMAPAPPSIMRLFEPLMIDAAFLVREFAFDAGRLRERLRELLAGSNVDFFFNCQADRVVGRDDQSLEVQTTDGATFQAAEAYNCAYSEINGLLRRSGLPMLPMKHEVAEIALIEPPRELAKLGVTVVDGPFFSTMPFPARKLHSLTHVRYTPSESWSDLDHNASPLDYLAQRLPQSRFPFMRKDAERFLPCLRKARHVDSLFEVKTVLLQNEVDDGRPILFRRNYGLPNLSVVMGAKIDNIYDVLTAIGAASATPRVKHATQ